MVATAGRRAEPGRARRGGARTFLTVRRVPSALLAIVLAGALTAWLGMYETGLPMAARSNTTVPLWRLLAMGAAVVPVVSLHSGLADVEVVATGRLRWAQRWYLVVAGVGGGVLYLAVSALTVPPSLLLIIARSWPAWLGLALVSGMVVGWRLAWTLPVATGSVLWYWGDQGNAHYRWWEFSARPSDDLPSLLLSAALLAVGLVAYSVTPWRRRRLAFWRSRKR